MPEKEILNRLGGVIKAARQDKRLTDKELAKKLGISTRHLIAIENENQKPSCVLLFRIIRELGIPADAIFYPELRYKHRETEKLRFLLKQCGEREISTIAATLQLLLEAK